MRHLYSIFILSILFVINSSCKKKNNNTESEKDTTPPVLTLKGSGDLILPFGIAATDPGATATDETDGDLSGNISSSWTSEVDVNNAAVKTVEYSVSDKSGNKAVASRKVTVKLSPSNLYGEYDATIAQSGQTFSPFTSTVTAGDNANQISINPFFGPVAVLKSDLSGATGNMLSVNQTASGVTVSGGGEILENGKKIVLTYTIVSFGVTYPCVQTMIKK